MVAAGDRLGFSLFTFDALAGIKAICSEPADGIIKLDAEFLPKG
jgi:hypothetical protein